MSENNGSPSYENLQQDIFRKHSQLKDILEHLVEDLDSEFVFRSLGVSLLFSDHEESRENLNASLIELAAYYLYPRFGKEGSRDPNRVEEFIKTLKELNRSRSANAIFNKSFPDRGLSNLQGWLQSQEEIVRGNSYPAQSRRLIEKIQGPFEDWFKSKIGIGPLRILLFLDAFEDAINEIISNERADFQNLNDIASQESFFKEFPERLSPSFNQMAQLVPELTLQEWDAIQELIGLTPVSCKKIQHPHELKNRPLYFLSNDQFLFIELPHVYDALFEALECCARSDQKFHAKRYEPNRRKHIEEEIYHHCLRLFPPSTVYKNLLYPDPDQPKGETELDIAISWGPFLCIIEAKGGQFRKKARLGVPAWLRDDIVTNIEDGFTQAIRAIRYIDSIPNAIFKEKKTGRILEIKKDSTHRIFPISITLHHFSGLTTQLALLKDIGLFKDSTYPWSVALTDFDIITRFVGYPDAFLHYIQRRLDLQHSEKYIIGDELDLFAYYLDTRLHPSQYWDRKEDGQECSGLFFSDNTERFDQFFQAEHLNLELPNIGLNLPPKFAELISELRQRDDYSARWIAFALLSLSQEAVNRLEEKLGSLKTAKHPSKGFLRDTFQEGDLVISLMTSSSVSKQEIEKHTFFRASIEKYRLKALRSIAIGIDLNDTARAFECAFWIECLWQPDEFFEDLLRKDRSKTIEL